MTGDQPLRVGVLGVGSMGRNHARIYRELADATLVGVADADQRAAREVAVKYGTDAFDVPDLLATVDAVSVAVPTAVHHEVVADCIDAGVDVLVEKPFVTDLDAGHDLATRASEAGVTLQVGHVERFNPAVRALADIAPGLDVIAVDARRLGPPLDRDIGTDAILDLMIHDVDVVRSLLDGDVGSVAASTAADGEYATATIEFDDVVASFTASRVTQQKVRRLDLTARECRVTLDYIAQSVEIHRSSSSAYFEKDGDLRHTTESVVERPMVDNGEPLKAELRGFVSAVQNDERPLVTATDGLRAVELSQRVRDAADRRVEWVTP